MWIILKRFGASASNWQSDHKENLNLVVRRMDYIRQAKIEDLERIAEIFVFNYRLNFYPIFKDDCYSSIRGIIKRCTPLGSKCTPHRPFVKLYRGVKRKRLHGDHFRITVEPVIVKKYRKTLANQGFSKRNWTPTLIRFVSKQVSNYGADNGSRTRLSGLGSRSSTDKLYLRYVKYYVLFLRKCQVNKFKLLPYFFFHI